MLIIILEFKLWNWWGWEFLLKWLLNILLKKNWNFLGKLCIWLWFWFFFVLFFIEMLIIVGWILFNILVKDGVVWLLFCLVIVEINGMLIFVFVGIVVIFKVKIDVVIIDFFNVFIFVLFFNLFVGWVKILYYESEFYK